VSIIEEADGLPAVLEPKLYKATDSTVYMPEHEVSSLQAAMRTISGIGNPGGDSNHSGHSFAFALRDGNLLRRFLACSTFSKAYWSFTVRSNKDGMGSLDYKYEQDLERYFENKAFTSRGEKEQVRNGYRPTRHHGFKLEKNSAFLFSLDELCTFLKNELLRKQDKPTGLLVVTGETNAAKSQVARGIIYQFLLERCTDAIKGNTAAPHKRKAHLVTFEDPIENTFHPEFFGDDEAFRQQAPFDYTPRQRLSDVPDLKSAFADALRQTPSVFFVGETRERRDWQELIRFAGTGHFVVTTAHAGSLLEAAAKIFESTKANTPGKRAEVASRIIGIAHLVNEDVKVINDGAEYKFTATFPALFRNTPMGVQSVVSDGLSSILPYFRPQDSNALGSLGRRMCVQKLFEQVQKSPAPLPEVKRGQKGQMQRLLAQFNKSRDRNTSPALDIAFKLDLQGE
jgi:hypothetical protein